MNFSEMKLNQFKFVVNGFAVEDIWQGMKSSSSYLWDSKTDFSGIGPFFVEIVKTFTQIMSNYTQILTKIYQNELK